MDGREGKRKRRVRGVENSVMGMGRTGDGGTARGGNWEWRKERGKVGKEGRVWEGERKGRKWRRLKNRKDRGDGDDDEFDDI